MITQKLKKPIKPLPYSSITYYFLFNENISLLYKWKFNLKIFLKNYIIFFVEREIRP